MEIQFENQCVYTYDHFLQLKRKTMDKGFNLTCYVFIAIAIAFGVFSAMNHWYKFSLIAIALFAFALYRLISTPIRLARFSTRKNREVHGKDLETVNVFYEDHVEATNKFSKGKTSIAYSDVESFLETKSLYIIGMNGGLVLLVDKEGFTTGTKEAFVTFMKEKCVNAGVNQ
ncbi:hypothetical protein M2140_000579 [Clostridiales Family XIII bacterium PM5-7]